MNLGFAIKAKQPSIPKTVEPRKAQNFQSDQPKSKIWKNKKIETGKSPKPKSKLELKWRKADPL